MTRIIEVVPYRNEWSSMFEAEAKLIKQALGDNCITVHHIGSTAVPGLAAKTIIDILPVVKNIVQVDQSIAALDLSPFTMFFTNGHISIIFLTNSPLASVYCSRSKVCCCANSIFSCSYSFATSGWEIK